MLDDKLLVCAGMCLMISGECVHSHRMISQRGARVLDDKLQVYECVRTLISRKCARMRA